VDDCSWIIAPDGARSISIKFLRFDASPDPTNMFVNIDECVDLSCSEISSSLESSLTKNFQSGYEVQASKTGIVLITFGFTWSGHSQARFALTYRSELVANTSSLSCHGFARKFWNHIAAVVEVVNSTSVATRVYVNGTLLAARTDFSRQAVAIAGTGGIAIGRVDPLSKPYGYLNGALDELMVWNKSLTAEEILAGMYRVCADQSGALLCQSFDSVDLISPGQYRDLGVGQPGVASAVKDDKYRPWCDIRGDQGMLLVSANKACTPYEKGWGFCTDRVRLPGAGYDYPQEELLAINAMLTNGSSLHAAAQMPGCVHIPLVISSNNAGRWRPLFQIKLPNSCESSFFLLTLNVLRNGGAIYHGFCDKSEVNLGKCFWVGLSNTPAASMILLENNTAGGALHLSPKTLVI
jgi:hypothetical protein